MTVTTLFQAQTARRIVRQGLIPLTAALVLLTGLAGMAAALDYQANAIQQIPKQGSKTGKIFVSEQGTRFEYQRRGQPVVEIRSRAANKLYILFPNQKAYFEFPAPKTGPAMGHKPDMPCQPGPMLHCDKTGTGKIGDIDTEIWAVKPKNAPAPMIIYWDPVRKMPIRQVYPNGLKTEMVFKGKVDYEGRKLENFQLITRSAGGDTLVGKLYYDPAMQVVVLEEHRTGFKRELTHIKTGPIDAALFSVPAGYKKITPPAAPQQMPQQIRR